MSTFEPGLEPPSNWRHQPPPPPPGPTPTTTGAASMVWACSAMGVLYSTCCVCMGAATRIVPQDEWMSQMPPDMPNRDMVIQMLPTMMVVLAIMGVVLMLVPAIVVAVLGFKVRAGSRGGTIAAMILLGIQGLAIALFLLMSLPGLISMPSVPNLIFVLIMAGTVLIFGVTMVSLYKALTEQRTATDNTGRVEPWG